MIRVVAPVGREVEGDGEAPLAGGEIGAIKSVRLLGCREAGVLPHCPGLLDIHRRIRPPGVRREPGPLMREREPFAVVPLIERLDLDSLGRSPDLRRRRLDWARWSGEGRGR